MVKLYGASPTLGWAFVGRGPWWSHDLSWVFSVTQLRGFLPLSLATMRKSSLIKEDWPWTPFALFPWSDPARLELARGVW